MNDGLAPMTALPGATTATFVTTQPRGRQPTCEDLLGLAAGGDVGSFARLYDRLAAHVYGLAHRVLLDTAQAEVVAQEVFIEVWTKAATFDRSRGSALAWVITITRRQAGERVRRSKK